MPCRRQTREHGEDSDGGVGGSAAALRPSDSGAGGGATGSRQGGRTPQGGKTGERPNDVAADYNPPVRRYVPVALRLQANWGQNFRTPPRVLLYCPSSDSLWALLYGLRRLSDGDVLLRPLCVPQVSQREHDAGKSVVVVKRAISVSDVCGKGASATRYSE